MFTMNTTFDTWVHAASGFSFLEDFFYSLNRHSNNMTTLNVLLISCRHSKCHNKTGQNVAFLFLKHLLQNNQFFDGAHCAFVTDTMFAFLLKAISFANFLCVSVCSLMWKLSLEEACCLVPSANWRSTSNPNNFRQKVNFLFLFMK